MRAPRVSMQVHPQHCTYAQLRDCWLAGEEAGVDCIFTWDHFFPLYGEADGPHFEGWSLLAAIGALTTRVQFGMLVTCMTYRNPDLLADMARTVDHISGGRLILGVGSGWFERDYEEYGYPFADVKTRLAQFREALPRIERRLARLNPGPVNGHIPVMIGGGGEKVMLKLVAQHADIWHGFGDVDTFKHKLGVLDAHCATVGRDPAEIERSVMLNENDLRDPSVIGRLHALGVTHFIGVASAPTFDLSGVRTLLAWRDAQ